MESELEAPRRQGGKETSAENQEVWWPGQRCGCEQEKADVTESWKGYEVTGEGLVEGNARVPVLSSLVKSGPLTMRCKAH